MDKRCADCSETKSLDAFYKRPGHETPFAHCIPCHAARAKASRLRMREIRIGRPPAPEKKCPDCQQVRSSTHFSRSSTSSTGLQTYCKDCWRIRTRKKVYNLSHDEFLALFEAQGGRCASCGDGGVRLVVDHCHTGGQVRGLLCDPCNLAEGMLRTAERARALVAYMTRSMPTLERLARPDSPT